MKRSPLKRSTKPIKRSPLKRRKNKNEIPQESRDAVALRSRDRCEFYFLDTDHTFNDCKRIGTDLHHIEKRRGRNHSPENLLNLCREHHDYIHANPAWAYDNNYMKKMGI